MEVIDVKTEATKYQTLQKRYWLVFLIALALFLGALTLLIIYSPTNYGVALWISIILSTLFLWGALYFFSGPYQSVAKRSRFFCHALQGLKSEEDVVIASIGSDEGVSKEGIPATLLTASFQEDGKTYERSFYLLSSIPALKVGERIRATSFASVLLSYEVLS
jgi:hypothetical protein